jgi:hypothetical protein
VACAATSDPDDSSRESAAERDAAAELERALDSGITELPENQPKGILGEKGADLRKVEDFTPDLNAGLSQENDMPVLWMGIMLAYLVFFPAAYVIMWMSERIPFRTKVIASVVGALGIVVLVAWLTGLLGR